MNIHISGASGFVGRTLCADLSKKGFVVFPWVRKPTGLNNELIVPDLTNSELVRMALQGCDVFIHLAARVHQIGEDQEKVEQFYKEANRDLSLELAKAVHKVGAKHFIYLSTVKVMGELSYRPLTEDIPPAPNDPYGKSKWEAECSLMDLASKTGLTITILRPPLIYGPGVKANFLNLIRWLNFSIPLPFRCIKNKRSLLFIGNLTDAIQKCIVSQPIRSAIYFVTDGEDLSSHELASRLCLALGSLHFSLPVPPKLIQFIGQNLGKKAQIDRLLGTLQVSNELFSKCFDWKPPFSVNFGLEQTVKWFNNQKRLDMMKRTKRIFDIFLALCAFCLLLMPLIIVSIVVKITSKGPVLYWSNRVGINNQIFRMPKFRSMQVGAPVVATHLLENPNAYLTPIGQFLRRSSIDELPQIWCILCGSMSWVGPRPALFNQEDLIALRTLCGVEQLVPGVTGWAQINGRDELDISRKVQFDHEYLLNRSLLLDVKILFWTFIKVLARKNITH